MHRKAEIAFLRINIVAKPESRISGIIDAYGGMITRAQAMDVEGGRTGRATAGITTVAAFLAFVNAKDPRIGGKLFSGAQSGMAYTANIQDRLYRIFNPVTTVYGTKQQERRTVVLGSEGSTIRMELRGRLSEYIDANVFERGDLVMVRNASYDEASGALIGVQSTVISKIMPAQDSAITDYSRLSAGMKNIDVVGKIVEIGPIRYVSRLSGSGQIAVADCVISDMERSVGMSLWGSSALATSKLNVGNFIKVEFCSAVRKNDTVVIYANEFSRIVSSKVFEGRLRPSIA
ncbi:MAG: hypothetical protein ACP5UH_03030 [Candidatus Micrarchaeia archaeon]